MMFKKQYAFPLENVMTRTSRSGSTCPLTRSGHHESQFSVRDTECIIFFYYFESGKRWRTENEGECRISTNSTPTTGRESQSIAFDDVFASAILSVRDVVSLQMYYSAEKTNLCEFIYLSARGRNLRFY
jgi:hypothetical protein